MPQSRDQYVVKESFTDQVGLGKEYAKVRYKGIDEIGYISRVEGPGDEISKGWYQEKKRAQPEQLYRVTIAANREYETNQYPRPGWESWTISFESTTFRKYDSHGEAIEAGIDKLNDIADLVSEEIPPMNDVKAKAKPDSELSVEATEAKGQFRPWSDAVLEVSFSGGGLDGSLFTYALDVENERIGW
jgi:hypothetical protein